MEQADKEMADLARQQAMEVWGAPETEQAPETPGPASARRESAQSLEESADRKSKWQKPGFKGQSGGGGKGSYHGSWRDPNDPWSYDSTPLGEAEKELLRNMAKMLMRHESEMRLLRQDTTWMFFVDTAETGILSLIQQKAEAWQKLYMEKKVTSSLRVVLVIVVFQELLARINALQQDQERMTRMHTVGWLVEGSQAINPCWTYQQWSHENQKVETSSQAPLSFTAAQDALQLIINNIGGPGVVLRFRATRPLTEKISSEVLPFVLVLSLRGAQAAQVHQALCLLSGCACFAVAGLRVRPDRGQQSQLAKALETSYTGVSFSDWKPGTQPWQKWQQQKPKPAGDALDPLRRAVRLCMSAPTALPQGRLNNPHNICYLNAASQAFAWVGRLTVDEDYCYGSARAAMRPVLDSGRPYLPQCLAWRAHLREWRSIAQQQDACQFMEHLLSSAKPKAYLGTWQARLTLPFQVVDGGSLEAPILLDLPGTSDLTLQELLQHWHEQHTIHAVEKHSGVILLQLKRYAHVSGNPVKDARAVRWLPGERVAVPCFCEAQGIRVRFDYFRIAYVLCHVGPHTEAGHYQAILCVPTPHPARAGTFEWHNAVLNDNSKPRRAGARDRQLLECNCYLLGLIWDPGQ